MNNNGTQNGVTGNRRQKNRSGRAINTQIDNCVNIAHTLLNIYNTSPLAPYKPRKIFLDEKSKSIFKIRKFVKPANRTERRRMEKFRKITSLQNLNNNNNSISNNCKVEDE